MQNHNEVLIVGGGPTGLVLANLLAKNGVKLTIIEKQKQVYPIPRATHVDEETLRNFQMTGLMAELEAHTSPFGVVNIVDTENQVLFEEEVIQNASEHFYLGSRFFDQPAFEKILRLALKKYANVSFYEGFEVQNIEQSEKEVQITAKNLENNEIISCSAEYLVGADGGRSAVRAALDIPMNALEAARDWVIVDSLLKNEADAKLLPSNFQYIFDPERLSIFAYGIGANNRWEFELKANEKMPSEEIIKSWVAKYISLDKIEITRIAKYAHNSLVAQKWQEKRIFLAGDSAHMMPPSAGQGLCSGVRDAVNLAWKLESVIQKKASISLLNTYEQERKPHLYEILKRTLFFSSRLQGDNALQRIWRKVQIQTIEFFSPLKEFLRNTYNSPPVLKEGFLSSKSALAGKHFPQFELNKQLSDDLIGYRFAVAILPNTLTNSQIDALKTQNVLVLSEILEFQPLFSDYLKKNKIDFALIRPDKIIFAAGKSADFDLIFKEFVFLSKK